MRGPDIRVVAVLAALAAGCTALAPTDEPREVVRGPLPTRLLLPEALAFPEPRPRSVRTQRIGQLGGGIVASYGAIDRSGTAPGEIVEREAEVLHTAVVARYGIDGRTELEVELATSFASSGIGGDDYALRLARGGVVAWEHEEDELLVTDVPVRVTHVLRPPAGGLLGMAVRGGVELPLGDEDAGTGSGGYDWDFGLCLERTRGRFTLTGGVDVVLVETPRRFTDAGVTVADFCLLTFGAECRWNDHASLLAGLRYRTPFTDDLDADAVDSPVLDASLGIAGDLGDVGRARWFAAVQGDALGDAGPDVVLSLGVMLGR